MTGLTSPAHCFMFTASSHEEYGSCAYHPPCAWFPLGRQGTTAAEKVPHLTQAMGLLAEPLDAREVARFLRRCPGLSQTTIGELLGEPSEFWLSVLTHFVDTFDFAGPHVATGLRLTHHMHDCTDWQQRLMLMHASRVSGLLLAMLTHWHCRCRAGLRLVNAHVPAVLPAAGGITEDCAHDGEVLDCISQGELSIVTGSNMPYATLRLSTARNRFHLPNNCPTACAGLPRRVQEQRCSIHPVLLGHHAQYRPAQQAGQYQANDYPCRMSVVTAVCDDYQHVECVFSGAQVKKKMTLEQFISNNRGINDGEHQLFSVVQ
jgi:Sec7 domain